MNTNACCKHCDPCPQCVNVNEHYIHDLLYAIDEKVSKHFKNILCKDTWGYACDIKEDISPIFIYKDILTRFYKSIISGYQVCLCPEEIQTIIEKVLNYVDIGCCTSNERCDIIIDESNLEFWTLNNPTCVAYEAWENLSRKVCPNFTFEVEYLPNAGRILYTLKVYDLRNSLSPELTTFAAAGDEIRYFKAVECWTAEVTSTDCIFDYTVTTEFLEECKLQYDLSIETIEKCFSVGIDVKNLEKCKLNYDLLVSDVNCKFSFDTYVKLLTCNLTYDLISTLIKCGVEVDFDVAEDLPRFRVGNRIIDPGDISNLPNVPSGCDLEKIIIELSA